MNELDFSELFIQHCARVQQGPTPDELLAAHMDKVLAECLPAGFFDFRPPSEEWVRRTKRRLQPRVKQPSTTKLWTPKPFVFIRSRVIRDGEDVSLDYIYERDGAVCHLCGKHVNRRDATRDHLVPISAGGPHTRVNVALAHWICNVRRGVGKRVPAQLRLID